MVIALNEEDWTYCEALSFEWHIKYPTSRRPRPAQFNGPKGRLDGLVLSIAHQKFIGKRMKIYVADEHFDYFRTKISDVTVANVEQLSHLNVEVSVGRNHLGSELNAHLEPVAFEGGD